jgi:hypothetical protein
MTGARRVAPGPSGMLVTTSNTEASPSACSHTLAAGSAIVPSSAQASCLMSWRLGSGWCVAEPASTPSTPVWHSTSWSRPWLVATHRSASSVAFRPGGAMPSCPRISAATRAKLWRQAAHTRYTGGHKEHIGTRGARLRVWPVQRYEEETDGYPGLSPGETPRDRRWGRLPGSPLSRSVSARLTCQALMGLDGRTGPSSRVTSAAAQEALSRLGKGLDLRKLVAGVGFEPTTSGL